MEGETLKVGQEGGEELVESGMDVFIFFFEFLRFGIRECEEEAICR